MQVTLGSPETFQVIQTATWQAGDYKGHLICGSQFGFFIVQPGNIVLTFEGFIVYASSPQEAGILVDGHLATQKKPGTATSTTKKTAGQSKARTASSTKKKKKAPATRGRSSSQNYFDRYYP